MSEYEKKPIEPASIMDAIMKNHDNLQSHIDNALDEIDEGGTRKKPNTYHAVISSGNKKSDITIQVAFTESSPEVCLHYDEIIAAAVSITNRHPKTVKTMMFKLGIELFKYYFIDKNLFDEAVLDEIDAFHYEQQDTKDRVKLGRARALYQNGEHEKAQKYCDRHGIDFNKVAYSFTLPDRKDKTSQIKLWLNDFFNRNPNPVEVTTIRAAMVDDLVIDNSNGDWNIVKNVASNEGYSSAVDTRGTWGKPIN